MKILIVEDHPLVRDGLALALNSLATGTQVEQAACCAEALESIAAEPALDLIVLDLGLPDVSGLIGLEQIVKAADLVPVLVLSAECVPERIRAVFDRGARGFVPKDTGREVLLGAVQLVLAGGIYLPPTVLAGGASAADGPKLTPRQEEVLRLIECGRSNKAIANELGIAEATVRQHLTAIFQALGVTNRTEAALQQHRRRSALA